MVIMAGSKATDRKNGTGAVAESSHFEVREREKDFCEVDI